MISPRIAAARQAIAQRDFDLAESIAARLLSEDPRDLDALEIRALVAIEREDDRTAEEALRSAIALAPHRRWPYADLIRVLLKLGRNADAEEVARVALAADPDNPDAHAMLGAMLSGKDQWFEAAGHFERAIAVAGEHPQLLSGLGRALLRLGRLQDARAPLEAAAAADPNMLEPAVHLAELAERLGQFDEAMLLLDRAEIIARTTGTDVDLQRSVLLDRMGQTEDALALLAHREDLSGAALLQRGRLHDRLGRHSEAWSDWTVGKARLAERAGRVYDAEQVRSEANRLADFFRKHGATLSRAEPRGDVPQPIFIIGFPRSGTTLTEQILASHSAILAGGELPFGAELRELAGAVAAPFPEGFAGQDDLAERMRDLYLSRAEVYGLLGSGANWFTDKMPANDFWLPLLRLAFPKSPVIHVRRHPLDVLTSVMAHDMTHGFNCGYRLEDAARHLALVDGLLENYWSAGFGPTHELRYEALVADQAGETRRLMEAIGLKVEPAQLRFHERAHVSPTPSYAQVREALNDRSIGRWRNFADELEAVRPIVADAMARGGYAG
ncbi:MAG: tetratricopeptide repeat-containing sulfotransferase family protein [Sphingomicrobium sp.]